MGKYSAEELSLAGDQFLGQKYSDMDCQTFVENAMRQVGLNMDLKGSNAWFREVEKNGWVGSPEECRKVFGIVPKGALLFIHAFDGGEEKRGYHDGKGNASHIGLKTGRSGADMVRRATEAGAVNAKDFNFGDGAIHSSSTRQHVATSKFADKTISGGGWNKVGLYNKFTYGETIDRILAGLSGGGSADDSQGTEEKTREDDQMYKAILQGGNIEEPINIRVKPDGALKDRLPQGTEVTVTAEKGDWCKIQYANGKKTGYVKGSFVNVADDDEPETGDGDEPIADDSGLPPEEWDEWDDSGSEKVSLTISLTTAQAAYALPVLEKLVKVIIDKVGRG